MRRTVTIDEHLLEEAQRLLGTETVEDTVEAGLRAAVEAIRREREARFEAFLDRVEFDLTDEQLREQRYSDLERRRRLEDTTDQTKHAEHTDTDRGEAPGATE